jgi:NAD(P)H-hydrate repair Nnr-like enzyme with NAD(P)H-hydrate dehydratase domain
MYNNEKKRRKKMKVEGSEIFARGGEGDPLTGIYACNFPKCRSRSNFNVAMREYLHKPSTY